MDELSPAPGWARKSGHARLGPGTWLPPANRAVDLSLIAERIARYGWCYDERDEAGLTDCFTADGTWEGSVMGRDAIPPVTGRGEIAGFLAQFWSVQDDQRRHVFANTIVEDLAGRAATAHAYLVLTSASGGLMKPVTTGPYRFEMQQDDTGVWRIACLVAGFDAPF